MSVLLRRLWIQATADRKRFGALIALVALGFLLWARIIIIENIPAQGLANPPPTPSTSTGANQGPPMPSHNGRELPERHVSLALTPLRDPLEINSLYFPRSTRVVQTPQDVGKSPSEAAENPEQAAARLRFQLQALVDRYRLEMLILAPDGPVARISGRVYRLGDRVPAIGNEEIWFEVVNISLERGRPLVELAYREHEFTVRMQDPGNRER